MRSASLDDLLTPAQSAQFQGVQREFAAAGVDVAALVNELATLLRTGALTAEVSTALVAAYTVGRASCLADMQVLRDRVETFVDAARAAELDVVHGALRTVEPTPARKVT